MLIDIYPQIQDRDFIKGSGAFAKLRVTDNKNNKGKAVGLELFIMI